MKCTITIEDLNRRIAVERDEILLAALLSRGVRFTYSCQSGNCGACKCRLISGQVEQLEFSDEALSQTQGSEGIILACRSRVCSDITIRLSAAESNAA